MTPLEFVVRRGFFFAKNRASQMRSGDMDVWSSSALGVFGSLIEGWVCGVLLGHVSVQWADRFMGIEADVLRRRRTDSCGTKTQCWLSCASWFWPMLVLQKNNQKCTMIKGAEENPHEKSRWRKKKVKEIPTPALMSCT